MELTNILNRYQTKYKVSMEDKTRKAHKPPTDYDTFWDGSFNRQKVMLQEILNHIKKNPTLSPKDFLIYIHAFELHSDLAFFQFTLTNGLYTYALNRLRYCVEAWRKAFHIDEKYPHKNLENKLDLVELIEKFKSSELDKLIEGPLKGSFTPFHRKLHQYTHHSIAAIRDKIFPGGPTNQALNIIHIKFNDNAYLKSIELVEGLVGLLEKFSKEFTKIIL